MGCFGSREGALADGVLYPGQGQGPSTAPVDMYGRPMAPPPPPGYMYGVSPPPDTEENMKLGAIAGAAAGMALMGGADNMLADGSYGIGPKIGI